MVPDENQIVTMGGAIPAIRNLCRVLTQCPTPSGHMILPLPPYGPVMVVGPRTDGVVIIPPPAESLEQKVSAEVQQLTTATMAYLRKMGVPFGTADATFATIMMMGWSALDAPGGEPSQDEAYGVLRGIADETGVGEFERIPWSPPSYTQGSGAAPSTAQDVPASAQAALPLEPESRGQALTAGVGVRHVPSLPDDMLFARGDVFARIFGQVTAGAPLMVKETAAQVGDIAHPFGLLPALLVHAVMDWTPVAAGTRFGFGVLLESDPDAMLGYRVAGLSARTPMLMNVAVAETARRMMKDGVVDFAQSMRAMQRWLHREGYACPEIDHVLPVPAATPSR